MEIIEMIKFFEGVKAQHEGALVAGLKNPEAPTIIKTYEFVIMKLKEWDLGVDVGVEGTSSKKGLDKD